MMVQEIKKSKRRGGTLAAAAEQKALLICTLADRTPPKKRGGIAFQNDERRSNLRFGGWRIEIGLAQREREKKKERGAIPKKAGLFVLSFSLSRQFPFEPLSAETCGRSEESVFLGEERERETPHARLTGAKMGR